MWETFFAFSNGFQKRSSSTQQSETTMKSAGCYLIFTTGRLY